ncbi:hypothetical protein MYX77_14890, partial [Acidobacteriia bacterium AH_259_A11_L15]|nr:hypothetical protein [Acidobacteriia bacterium AH_259_A11_L15]
LGGEKTAKSSFTDKGTRWWRFPSPRLQPFPSVRQSRSLRPRGLWLGEATNMTFPPMAGDLSWSKG